MTATFVPLRELPDAAGDRTVAIFSAHDRRDVTMGALRSLAEQELAGIALSVVVVDDGSTDGTAAAIAAEFPTVTVESGDGTLFWVGGMARAMEVAMTADPDHLLWMNDDVDLAPDAVRRMLDCARRHDDRAVCAGAFRDATTGECTYSGFRRHGRSPLQVERVEPSDQDQSVDTINGNLVVVPRAVYADLGPLDQRFVHLGGDIDYGYTAVRRGFGAFLAPGWMGTCSRNVAPLTYADGTRPLSERLRLVTSPKQIPVSAGVAMMRKHAGPAWPVYVVRRYARAYLTALRAR